jgi:hypothetical protein
MTNQKIDKARLIIKRVGECRRIGDCSDCPFLSEKTENYCLPFTKYGKLLALGSTIEFQLLKVEMAKEYIQAQKKLKFLEEL